MSVDQHQRQPQSTRLIVVCISGSGSNLQALIDACADGSIPQSRICLVVSNRPSAYGLTRAANAVPPIPCLTMTLKQHKDAGKSRLQYDVDLADAIIARFRELQPDQAHAQLFPDVIVLAGFMHILSPEFLARFPPGLFINLHPALPGQFDGAHAIERAFQAFQEGKIKETGVMVHRVIAEVDRGEVVLTETVPIEAGDTVETLEERIHATEHVLIVKGTRAVLNV
ncbi:hypothetical protein HDU83_002137 [Entophlyctis luteolus]|nr:hypothetical protein HDU82_003286 [Entophlyctis luteolus]KAJ3347378.1 hypothetical protein HDU83_002137 [Entophlyctis luteolus]